MNKKNLITALDIGSSKVSAVACELGPDGMPTILAQYTVPSKGVSRGIINDLDGAVFSVSKALSRISEVCAARSLKNIYVNVSGTTIKLEASKGMIPLSMRGREITLSDMSRCANVASTIQLAFDRDIIHKMVNNFSIDDQPSIKNPLGLYGSRLACEMFVMTCSINQIQNIYKCVNNAGHDVKEIVYSGLADGISVLTKEERVDGALVLDIGASLIEISIFYGGVLADTEVLPIGGNDIKGDIKDSSALNEIITKINARMDGFKNRCQDINSFVLVGGFAFTDGIVELLEDRLHAKVRVGIPREIKGDISSLENITLTTALGLVSYAKEELKDSVLHKGNLITRVSSKVVDIFNNYF